MYKVKLVTKDIQVLKERLEMWESLVKLDLKDHREMLVIQDQQ